MASDTEAGTGTGSNLPLVIRPWLFLLIPSSIMNTGSFIGSRFVTSTLLRKSCLLSTQTGRSPKKWNPFKWRALSVSPHHQRHVTRIHGPTGLEFREKLRSRHITDFQSLSGEDAVRDARMKERGIGPYRNKSVAAEWREIEHDGEENEHIFIIS